jgi:DNA modification methylase
MEINKIACMDCLAYLKSVPDASIDLVIADYPFNSQDGRDDYVGFINETAGEFFRVLREGGNLVVINNPSNIFKTSASFQGFTFRNGVALIRKGSLRPAWMFGFQHNYMLLLCKGSKKLLWNGARKNHDKTGLTDVMEYQNGYRGKRGAWHPQAVPLSLMETLIKLLSDDGGLVLDPFMGSGTTAVAAVLHGRRFVGCELNPRYAEMARVRVAAVLEQRKL